jgi:hypothetical protein
VLSSSQLDLYYLHYPQNAGEQELLFLPGGRLLYRVITSLVERGRLEIGSSARWNSKEEKGCDEQ